MWRFWKLIFCYHFFRMSRMTFTAGPESARQPLTELDIDELVDRLTPGEIQKLLDECDPGTLTCICSIVTLNKIVPFTSNRLFRNHLPANFHDLSNAKRFTYRIWNRDIMTVWYTKIIIWKSDILTDSWKFSCFFCWKLSAKNDAKLAPYQNLYNKNFVTKYVSMKGKEGKQTIFDIEPKNASMSCTIIYIKDQFRNNQCPVLTYVKSGVWQVCISIRLIVIKVD